MNLPTVRIVTIHQRRYKTSHVVQNDLGDEEECEATRSDETQLLRNRENVRGRTHATKMKGSGGGQEAREREEFAERD